MNLKEINAYNHGTAIDITLQFLGDPADYGNNEYFSKTVTLYVDLEAPIINITNLVNLSGLSMDDVRNVLESGKYNTSKTEGVLRYFAFAVDYDRVVFDTYDYLDKLIGFRFGDA